jgi:hypothetical protein
VSRLARDSLTIATVSDEKQKEGQDLRSKLTALGFKPEQDKTEEGRSVGMVGGVRKSSTVSSERKAQEPSRIRDVTEELLEKGVGGLIITVASKQRQD